jgi:topoisomerase-4 subunit A
MIEEEELENKPELHQEEDSIGVSGMFESWFLDYASYVILERAVPSIFDGLKPVQRRILHAMDELDDGRFNKVANIIGTTMSYHPHGDMSIGDALVNMGQKDLMMDCQGNWGDIRTGDRSAAPRYIEARLSKFALEVAFNPQTTEWGLSYDGRKKEPIDLPMKFPLLLAQGAEGIAVGLATKILPHNFCELIQASIDILEKKPVTIYPDFLTGGLADCSRYEDGKRGGKVRVRARMEIVDKKTIAIREIPFSTTTVSLIDSILVANDKGKIKIKKVLDNTAAEVEILIELQPGISPSVTMDALFAFTQCEVGISPNCCVIHNDKPVFLGVSEILKINTDHTVALLKRELEIKLAELEDKWHFSSLEKIFIENRIYRDIEECETWEAVIEAIDKGLDPFKHLLMREVTRDDIIRLTEIKIKRISRYDAFKADEALKALEDEMKAVKSNLKHLIAYSIKYFENLLAKYGKGRERKTELTNFDVVEIKTVAFNNEKLYVNLTEGFIGFGKDMKKEQFLSDCSDIDDIICFYA